MASSRLRTALAFPLMLAFLGGVPVEALAWGKAGHRVVASLTTSLLSPPAQRHADEVTGPGG